MARLFCFVIELFSSILERLNLSKSLVSLNKVFLGGVDNYQLKSLTFFNRFASIDDVRSF